MLFLLVVIVATYVALEVVVSTTFYALGWIQPEGSKEVEAAGTDPIFVFDPIAGYRIGPTPRRYAVIDANGELECSGILKGNNLGFPDSMDFDAKRPPSGVRRVAVMGDSMTAAQFLPRNWPETAEAILAKDGPPIEVMNFAVDGGGIVNWWGIITKRIDVNDFEIDGIVFAVCCDDLYRGLFVRHDYVESGEHSIAAGRVQGMKPPFLPRALSDAERWFLPFETPLISPQAMDRIMGGERYHANDPMKYLVVTRLALMVYLINQFREQGKVDGEIPFDADLQRLISDIAEVLQRRKIPALVVSVPNLDPGPPTTIHQHLPYDVQKFAELLGTTAVAGSGAFADLSSEQQRACYLRSDPHLSSMGSDRFAAFLAPKIRALVDGRNEASESPAKTAEEPVH
jgi:hypothetical protein